MVETFSSRVRSLDCVAWETRFTTSGGTSLTPNFLAEDEKTDHQDGTPLHVSRWFLQVDRPGFISFLNSSSSAPTVPPVLELILDSSLQEEVLTAER